MDMIIDAQPAARMDLLRKLDTLWRFCEPELDPDLVKPDVRRAQLALQVIKETKTLFLLDKVPLPAPEPATDTTETPRQRDVRRIHEGLLELEQRDAAHPIA